MVEERPSEKHRLMTESSSETKHAQYRRDYSSGFWAAVVADIFLALLVMLFIAVAILAIYGNGKTTDEYIWLPVFVTASTYVRDGPRSMCTLVPD